ncbi:MAG: wax ester/triacylglycerol synthase family O-acyltransferase [Candidatus Nanopelagicales bacterium]|jgi:diacylglycerol O-acyltransferase
MPDRLSPLDQTFLLLERDGQPMHIGGLMVFEGPAPKYEDLCAHLDSRLDQVPRYRQRIQSVPLNIGQPIWVDDENFELEFHVRHTAVPKPGKAEQLQRLAGRLLSQRLDLDRPLWEIWLVEGLAKGRWALINKAHHAMIDGLSGHDIMEVILDPDPEGRETPPSSWEPEPAPGTVGLVTDAVVDSVMRPGEHLTRIVSRVSHPREFAEHMAVRAVGSTSVGSRLLSTETTLGGAIGQHRRWGWVEGDLDTIKAVKNAFGGTVNDVILTAVTGGFRELLASRGIDMRPLQIQSMIPVSMRMPGDSTGGNQVSAMFAQLPIGVDDPVERLHAMTRQMDRVKKSGTPLTVDSIIGLADFVPPMLFATAGRVAANVNLRAFDTVTTNVPGPQIPLYLLGRELQTLIPFVPLGPGVRISTAIVSYNGTINFGVTADYDSVRDLPVFLDGVSKTLDGLRRAVLAEIARRPD